MARYIDKVIIVLIVLAVTRHASGQEYSRTEVGSGALCHTIGDQRGNRGVTCGVAGQVTANFSSFISLDGSAAYLPRQIESPMQDSGKETTVVAGLKANVRGRRISFFGKMEPGFSSFSCGVSVTDSQAITKQCARRTHFAFQYGAGVEYLLSRDWSVRGDAAQILLTEFDQTIVRTTQESGIGFTERTIGRIVPHLEARIGVERHFGAVQKDFFMKSEMSGPRLEMGVVFSLQNRVHQFLNTLDPERGLGAWLSWDLGRYTSLDVAAFHSSHDDRVYGYSDGGPDVQALAGVKIGIKREHLGVFAKARPGAIVFSHVLDTETVLNQGPIATWSKSPNLVVDTGGVFELYPMSHLVVRFDGGNDQIFYGARTVRVNGEITHVSAATASSFLFLASAGVRF